MPPPPDAKPVAAVITEWRTNSHADVILTRMLDPEAWGHASDPWPWNIKLVSVYCDQFPERDLARSYCEAHGIPIFPTITEAVGVGTRGVPVEGVLIIGEHGRYPRNLKGQQLYPRRRLFEGVAQAFQELGRSVPVFMDKHLSYEWRFAKWMADTAKREGFPMMAGSSLPVAYRTPEATIPIGSDLTDAFALGYSDLDAYGFHALETLQCMVERRRGGETGVASVRCVTGRDVWEGLQTGLWSRALLDALLPARQMADPRATDVRPLPRDALFLIEYRDGLNAAVGMFNSVGECFAFSGQRADANEPDAMVFDLESGHPFGHFGHLLRAIEHMVVTGEPAYPVERTLLTTGMLSALLQSKAEGGTTLRTPHLETIAYEAGDWPFATGPRGTPA